MPRGLPDISAKPGTPSGGLDDQQWESGSESYSRPEPSGSGDSASLTFEDWQRKAGIGSGAFEGGEEGFSRSDGHTDYYNNELAQSRSSPEFPAAFKAPTDVETHKAKLRSKARGRVRPLDGRFVRRASESLAEPSLSPRRTPPRRRREWAASTT